MDPLWFNIRKYLCATNIWDSALDGDWQHKWDLYILKTQKIINGVTQAVTYCKRKGRVWWPHFKRTVSLITHFVTSVRKKCIFVKIPKLYSAQSIFNFHTHQLQCPLHLRTTQTPYQTVLTNWLSICFITVKMGQRETTEQRNKGKKKKEIKKCMYVYFRKAIHISKEQHIPTLLYNSPFIPYWH